MAGTSRNIDTGELITYSNNLVQILRSDKYINCLEQCLQRFKTLQSQCDQDFDHVQKSIREIVDEINDLEKETASIEEQRKTLKKFEKDELRAQMKLSMYASLTNIIPNMDDLIRISGHIVEREKKIVNNFEIDPAKLTAFDTCNCIWKMINLNFVMVTGGRNRGHFGEIKNREKHRGSFETIHIQDVLGHEFTTHLGNVFTIVKGTKPWVALPKGQGMTTAIDEVHLHEFGVLGHLARCFSFRNSFLCPTRKDMLVNVTTILRHKAKGKGQGMVTLYEDIEDCAGYRDIEVMWEMIHPSFPLDAHNKKRRKKVLCWRFCFRPS
ncbi:unnamed protein product [Fraxinus pennsylvanica]|uniref:Kinetochore protein Spc24 n=1 Tax=Fraxinus pennsylvanica TaxID=56036 RepID=A0AAD2E8Z9_9LAMI|nr:unnamed protein product [Fraxinus pennsylvanica]